MSAELNLGDGGRAERRGVDRRRRPTSAWSRHAWFGGRRRGDRRTERDGSSYVDLYEPWLGGALVAIGALCAVDAVYTLLYLQKGGEEANPVMGLLLEAGPETFVVVKCLVTNLGLLVLCLHKNFRWVKQIVCALLAIYTLLLGYHLWLFAAVN